VAEHKKGRHASGAAPSMRELLGRRSQISLLLCRDGLAGGSMGRGARGTDVFFWRIDQPVVRINVVRQVPHAAGVDVVVDDRGSGEPVGKDKCA
jgi:hypothetical protein